VFKANETRPTLALAATRALVPVDTDLGHLKNQQPARFESIRGAAEEWAKRQRFTRSRWLVAYDFAQRRNGLAARELAVRQGLNVNSAPRHLLAGERYHRRRNARAKDLETCIAQMPRPDAAAAAEIDPPALANAGTFQNVEQPGCRSRRIAAETDIVNVGEI